MKIFEYLFARWLWSFRGIVSLVLGIAGLFIFAGILVVVIPKLWASWTFRILLLVIAGAVIKGIIEAVKEIRSQP